MEGLGPVLRATPVVRELSRAHLALLEGCATNVRFRVGDLVFRQGEDADRLYIVRQGRVALEVHVPGRGAVALQTVGDGDVLGWSWLVSPHRAALDARAVEPTRALMLDGECLRQKCDADPQLGWSLMKLVVPRMANALNAARVQLLDLYGNHG
jgi:CRP-like cAMP-binding protein